MVYKYIVYLNEILLEHQLNETNCNLKTKFLTMKRWRNDINRRRTCLLRYLLVFTAQPYGPLTVLASFNTDAHSSPSTAFSPHLLILISLRSFSTSSSQLSLHLPLLPFLLLASGLISNIFRPSLIYSYYMSNPF